MKIITVNVNGIRSASQKGLIPWLAAQDADVVCLQETKAQVDQLDPALHYLPTHEAHFFDAQKKGYSGVALFLKKPPLRVTRGLGWQDMDAEGRYIRADYENISVISIYLPSGSSGPERQAHKFSFMERFMPFLRDLRAEGREFIICGDWNIAHKNIDLKNWRSNQKNSGFLPEEREWMTQLLEQEGWVDAFRIVDQTPDQYTWWSNRGQAWAKNVGWRIDYHIVTPGLRETIQRAAIYKDQRFSDHAPLTIEYVGDL